MTLCDEDFGCSVELSRINDLHTCAADADYAAEQAIKSGSRMCYVFKLDSVYVPSNGRMVEVRQVELESAKHVEEGYGGTD